MKKICMITPCLMLENNRKANKKAINFSKENYFVDEIVIYDQSFEDDDYDKDCTYIGHQKERQGFTKSRNELLKWFYNSDYDYALWMDANGWVSTTSLNELNTIITLLKEEKLETDVILSTLGIICDGDRIELKKRDDYFSKIHLLKAKPHQHDWLHGCFIKNFKKSYGIEIYIDERCNPKDPVNVPEDIFFVRLLKSIFDCYVCPTVCINKANNKTSTWMNKENSYNYPVTDWEKVSDWVKQNLEILNNINYKKNKSNIVLDRIEEFKENLKPYKSRKKEINERTLFDFE